MQNYCWTHNVWNVEKSIFLQPLTIKHAVKSKSHYFSVHCLVFRDVSTDMQVRTEQLMFLHSINIILRVYVCAIHTELKTITSKIDSNLVALLEWIAANFQNTQSYMFNDIKQDSSQSIKRYSLNWKGSCFDVHIQLALPWLHVLSYLSVHQISVRSWKDIVRQKMIISTKRIAFRPMVLST